MKNKIVFRLTMSFTATLILFSIIISSIFITLFKNHTMELHRADLEKRATNMASVLSEYLSETGTSAGIMGGKQGGYGAYLRFLDDIAMTDVWIVDENLELITQGHLANQDYNYSNLPEDAETVVNKVFGGITTFSEGFSDLLNTPTLTVGTPIIFDGKVIGALLLHSPVEGMNEAITQGFNILGISVISALIISIFLSVIFAISFTRPLKKMKNVAIKLAGADYSAKTGVFQKDEIGELASAIDILSEQLDIASHKSEQLQKLRRDFVANISHELRTPVTVLRGSLEALCDEVITDPVQLKSYYRQMLSESLYLQRLVNDLLDLSRLQNTDFVIEMNELNLCEVLNDIVRSAKYMAQIKGIDIKQEQDTDMFLVTGDYGRLRQMLFIILDNAIKFSPQNGGVTVSLKDMTVSIRDNGTGIPQEDLPYIFDRFYKVKSEQNKDGTGLGLSIAKQIADRHNIIITVNSLENEGTEFIFKF